MLSAAILLGATLVASGCDTRPYRHRSSHHVYGHDYKYSHGHKGYHKHKGYHGNKGYHGRRGHHPRRYGNRGCRW